MDKTRKVGLRPAKASRMRIIHLIVAVILASCAHIATVERTNHDLLESR